METPTPTPEEQGIKNIASKILDAKGDITEQEYYQPPVSIGGDYFGNVVLRTFKKNNIVVSDKKETFDDGSGSYSLRIHNLERGFIGNLLHTLGMYEGKLVFMFEHNQARVFQRGNWQKQLESLV